VLDEYKTKLRPARVSVAVGDAARAPADAVVVAAFQGKKRGDVGFDRGRAQVVLKHLVASKDFAGRPKDEVLVRTLGKIPAPRLLVLGLGKRESVTASTLRDYAARAALALDDRAVRRIAVDVPPNIGPSLDTVIEAMAEGVELALFNITDFKASDPERRKATVEVTFWLADRAGLTAARRGARRGVEIERFTNAGRMLTSLPSNEKPPARLADMIAGVARAGHLKVEVLDEKQLARRNMDALLAVGKGSVNPPRMVIARWDGGKPGGRPVVLVGKGITMDTGGISIKPTFGTYPMWHMKWDMTGAASVMCAAACAGALAENMPSGSAYKPSDVVRASNGVTIEVINSDAEGRVVLADGLSHAQSFKPQAVIDVATLTGTILLALGPRTSGVFSNSEELADRIKAAGERTQDSLWRMPIFDWYDEIIESPIADWKNAGGAPAGAGTAARFLQKFVGPYPWAHLDIASTAWTDRGPGEIKHPWQPKGTTATGVRLLIETLRAWRGPPKTS
jgi:leucyl aminopeptidase